MEVLFPAENSGMGLLAGKHDLSSPRNNDDGGDGDGDGDDDDNSNNNNNNNNNNSNNNNPKDHRKLLQTPKVAKHNRDKTTFEQEIVTVENTRL